MRKNDTLYLDHIRDALSKVTEYTREHDLDSFLKSNITQDAVIRQLEIIGEATKRISKAFKTNHSDIPWTDMAGMRDKLIHDYIDVDLWIVWNTAVADVPELMDKLKSL